MSNYLTQAYDPEEFRKTGYALIDLLADHLKTSYTGVHDKVIDWVEPDVLYHTLKEQPWVIGDNRTFWESLLKNSIHLHHPRYMGHQVTPVVPPAALLEMASALLNNGMAIYEMGPFSTVAERLVLEWLAEKMGFAPSAGGYLTSGGSAGNLSALLTARRIIVPEYEKENSRLGILVSEEAHYSIARSALIMGIPADNVVKVPIGADHRIISSLLPDIMEDATRRGIRVFALVANAGTTATGSYDDLEAAASFCKTHGIWFHADGAHGAAAVLSPKYSHLVEGIGLADSVVVDFHKMMMMPALTTAVVFRNAAHSYATFSQDASYLLKDDGSRPWFDSAMRTLECTKKMMGTKILYMLKFYGEELFREYVETTFGLARTFAALIGETPDFELECQPSCNIVCFRYRPQNYAATDLDLLNERLRRRLLEDGAFYITKVRLAGGLWLRTTLMNPFTTGDDLNALLAEIREQSIASS